MSKIDISYAHANARLLARYGIEITRDQWEEIGNKFRRSDSAIMSRRKTYIGDEEGWVQIGDVWVCAYYDVKRGCVSTFYARPPDLVITVTGNTDAAKGRAKDLQHRIEEMAKDHREKSQKQHAAILAAQADAAAARDDVAWFKACVFNVRALSARGLVEATWCMEALCGLPRGLSPTRETKRMEDWLSRFFEEKERYRNTVTTLTT